MTEQERTWFGITDADPSSFPDVRHTIDLAKAGRWSEVLAALAARPQDVNAWRPSGTSWWTPLHHAAWHGAPADVVQALLDRGAWRTLRAADGQRPADVAVARGHAHLAGLLQPADVDEQLHGALDAHLAGLVHAVVGRAETPGLRAPQTSVLAETPGKQVWFTVPGMYGGFSIALREAHLYVESWCRLVDGSGLAHVVSRHGYVVVAEGFV